MTKNVLLIEDDIFLAEDIRYFIEDLGHHCTHYSGSDQLYENIENINRFDLIILDLMMLKGTYIKKLRKNEETGERLYSEIINRKFNKKIIILTAKDKDNLSTEFKYENLIFLKKPVDENIINKIIDLL